MPKSLDGSPTLDLDGNFCFLKRPLRQDLWESGKTTVFRVYSTQKPKDRSGIVDRVLIH